MSDGLWPGIVAICGGFYTLAGVWIQSKFSAKNLVRIAVLETSQRQNQKKIAELESRLADAEHCKVMVAKLEQELNRCRSDHASLNGYVKILEARIGKPGD